jgi:hypothetical protein
MNLSIAYFSSFYVTLHENILKVIFIVELSLVGTVTGYRMDDRGIEVLFVVGTKYFSFSTESKYLFSSPPRLPCNGYVGLFWEDKAAGT